MSLPLNRPAGLEGLRRNNLRAVLRALYRGEARSRSELAMVTGLTKPTVSTLVAELMSEGLVTERGRGEAAPGGGKRPTLLRFETGARQVVGVSVGDGQARGVLSDLAGTVSAIHVTELGGDPEVAVLEVVAGLRAQLDAKLACVGVGLPGPMSAVAMAESLTARLGLPVHVAGRAELGALGQLAYGGGADGTLVSVVVDDGVEVGVCLSGGTLHYGSDLSALAPGLGWATVRDEIRSALRDHATIDRPGALVLALRSAASKGERMSQRLCEDLASRLGAALAWVVATLRPAQVALGGPLAELGSPFLDLLRAEAAARLPAWQLSDLELTVAYTHQISAMGAVALAVQRELELLFG